MSSRIASASRRGPARAAARKNLNPSLTAAAVLCLLSATPAVGVAFLNVRVTAEGAAVEAVEVTLEPAEGSAQRATDEDGDGFVFLLPEAGPGDYRLTVSLGEERASRELRIPESGEVNVTYSAGDGRLRVETRESALFESEIVVTARKREENVQRIPIAITALSDTALEARSIRDLRDVGDFAPNVDFSLSAGNGGAPSEATVYIRGLGQIDTAIYADPGVGIYVDGVYLARSQGSVLDLLDVDRVEVLRGPQGTLFGKNTTGGAISLVTERPSEAFGGYVRATVGELDRRDLGFRVNGTLAEGLYGSLAGSFVNRDGYARSLASGRVMNDDDRDSARAALRWLAAEDLTFDLAVDGLRERRSALDQTLVAIFDSDLLSFYNTVVADAGLTPIDESFITGDLYTSFSDFPSRSDGDVVSARLHAAKTWRDLSLLSITAYREYQYLGSSDFDGTPNRIFDRSYDQRQHQVSEEVQLSGTARDGRLTWVGGALYFRENPREDARVFLVAELFDALEAAPGAIYSPPGAPAFFCDPGPPPLGVPCFGGAGNPLNFAFFVGDGQVERLDIETTSYAAFGEGTWSLGERLSLTTGVRYTYEEKRFDFFRDPRNGPIQDLTNEDHWEAWSPRASLAFQAREETMLYASVSRGFKSGGFNGRAFGLDQLDPYDPERVWAYEAGVKTDLLGRRLRLNGAVFHNDYEDIQFSAAVLVGGVPTFVVLNAATATVDGFELELEAHPRQGLSLSAGVGYTDSEYTDIETEGDIPDDGVLPKTPRWNLSFSAQKAFSLDRRGSLIVRGDYAYKSDLFNDITNSPLIETEAYGLLNARILYANPDDSWEVALFGTNLTDEEYVEHGSISPAVGLANVIAGRPREWGLSVEWRF